MEEKLQAMNYSSRTSILSNGEIVNFKLLNEADEQALRAFFSQIPDHEVENLRHDVRDPNTISRWIATLDYQYAIPLLAWDEDFNVVIGVASLHLMKGVYRHIADVRIVVGKSHRKLGLGSAMIKELISIGMALRLHYLRAEILSDNQLGIKAFRQLGFEMKCTIEGYFMTPQGKVRDATMLMKRLQVDMEEDFFFVF